MSRLQRLPERDRAGRQPASGRAGMRGDRRPDEKLGRGGQAVRRQARTRRLPRTTWPSYCKDNFTAYKRPKHIEFRDELPKTNVGKILRRELRAEPPADGKAG